MIIQSTMWDSLYKKWVKEMGLEPLERIDLPNGEYALYYKTRYGKPFTILFNSDRSVKQVQV